MQIRFDNLSMTVRPDAAHEWILPTAEVAEGYGVSPEAVRSHKSRNSEDFIEGRHFVSVANCNTLGGSQELTYWTKRGVIQLGFFIKSDRARRFRFWAEDLILSELTQPSPVDAALLPRVVLLETEVADLKQEVAGLKAALSKPLSLRPAYAQKQLVESRSALTTLVRKHFGPPAHDQHTLFLSTTEVVAYLKRQEQLQSLPTRLIAQTLIALTGVPSTFRNLNTHCKRGYWLQVLTADRHA